MAMCIYGVSAYVLNRLNSTLAATAAAAADRVYVCVCVLVA